MSVRSYSCMFSMNTKVSKKLPQSKQHLLSSSAVSNSVPLKSCLRRIVLEPNTRAVISLISSSHLTEGVQISEMKCSSVCYRRMALNGTLFYYQVIYILLLILLLNAYNPPFHQFISFSHVPVPKVLSSSHLSVPPFYFLLAIPHAKAHPLSSYCM